MHRLPDRDDVATGDGRAPVDRPTAVGGARARADGVPPDAPPTPRWAAGHVIVAVIVALVLASLLNAAALLDTAQRQPLGPTRTVAVGIAERLAVVAEALRLDVPRTGIERALGRGDATAAPAPPTRDDEVTDDPDDGASGADATEDEQDGTDDGPGSDDATEDPDPQVDTDRQDADGSGAADARPSPDEGSEVEEDPGDDDAEPTTPDRGPITEDDPLTMYVGGDSLVGQFGMAMEDLADDTGVIETTEVVYEFGSGLSRPDFIDWPARLATVSEEQEPEVIVLYFGGNDAQPLEIDGAVREPEDPEWQEEYRQRVRELMAQLDEAGHTVYWMGMPIPRDADLDARYRMLNEIYSSEADRHDTVHFVSAWDVFAGPDGEYSEYLPNRNGDVVDMRLDDGIHYTTAGAYRIARVAIARIAEDHDIELEDD